MFVSKRTAPAVVKLLVVLLRSAALPLAVLKLPVVLLKRTCPKTGVALRRSNPCQRQRENESSNNNKEKRSSIGGMAKHIKLLPQRLF
jgi:hypothetical protein